MVDYELAKQLKDAGFPQGGVRPTEPAGWGWSGDDVINPTLSELIEACGDRFHLLSQSETTMEIEESWTAMAQNRFAIPCWGKTPEEAVAKLWLALNTSKEAKAADEPPAQSPLP